MLGGYGTQAGMSGAANGASPAASALLAAQLAQLAAAAAASSASANGTAGAQAANGGALDLSQSSDALSSYLQSMGQYPLATNPMLIPASALQNGYH